MQIDLFAPKESDVVSLTPKASGYLASYQHQPNYQYPPLMVVSGVLDAYVTSLLQRSKNLAVSWWLMGSYAYYYLDETIISDEFFDYLTVLIRENYDEIVHVNKDLITEDRLTCGSAFDLRIYPTRVMSCTQQILTQMRKARPD